MNQNWSPKRNCLIGEFDTTPGGVLQVLSDRDDRMGAKIKPKKIPGPKFNAQKIPCRIS